jgi:hypothetical protein
MIVSNIVSFLAKYLTKVNAGLKDPFSTKNKIIEYNNPKNTVLLNDNNPSVNKKVPKNSFIIL